MAKKNMSPNSLANLTPWQPGQSGNPEGKRGKRSLIPILDKILSQKYTMTEERNGKVEKSEKLVAEWIMIQLVQNAFDGKEKSIAMILDRIDGVLEKNIKLDMSESSVIDSIKEKIRKNSEKIDDVSE